MSRLAIVLLVLAAGCAATVESDPQVRAFRKVGVVSVAGSYLTQMNVGVTAFGNERREIDVSKWNLDATFAAALADAIRERKRIEAIVIALPPDELRSLFKPSSLQHMAISMDSRWVTAQELFKRLAAVNGVDALAVLVPATSGDIFNGTNQLLRGVGIYTRSLGDRTTTSTLHAICRIVVVSGATGRIIADTDVSSEPVGNFGAGRQRAQPWIAIPEKIARKPVDQMDPTELDELRELAQRLPLKAAASTSISYAMP